MSDFHEMSCNLRMKEERFLSVEHPSYLIDRGGRRLGLERRQFTYSHYYPERRKSQDRRNIAERRILEKPAGFLNKP